MLVQIQQTTFRFLFCFKPFNFKGNLLEKFILIRVCVILYKNHTPVYLNIIHITKNTSYCHSSYRANFYMDYINKRGIEMKYDDFKKALSDELEKYNIKVNNKIIAIIFKVICNLNIID